MLHKLRPRQEGIEKIVSKIARRAAKVLAKLDAEAIEPDALDAVRAMSQQGELAIKVESGEEASGRMLASADGFSLQAARHLHESDRGLAFLVRYVLRPPLALSRMSELPSGNILIRFKRALGNGTGAMELKPMSLRRRLASRVAPPGSHDTCYFGVFAACAARPEAAPFRYGLRLMSLGGLVEPDRPAVLLSLQTSPLSSGPSRGPRRREPARTTHFGLSRKGLPVSLRLPLPRPLLERLLGCSRQLSLSFAGSRQSGGGRTSGITRPKHVELTRIRNAGVTDANPGGLLTGSRSSPPPAGTAR